MGLFFSSWAYGQQIDTIQAVSISDRVGINAFRFTLQALGRYHVGVKKYVFARAGSDWLINQRLVGNKFVTKDFFTQTGFGWQLANDLAAESYADLYDYATYETRIGHAGGRLKWTNGLVFPSTFALFAGFRLDKRRQVTDYGPSLVLQGGSKSGTKQDSTFHWTAVFENHWLKPRKISLWGGSASYQKGFGKEAGFNIGLGYYKRRMDDYSGQNIQRVSSDTLLSTAQIMFNITPRLKLTNYSEFGIPLRDFKFMSIQTGQTKRNLGYNQTEFLNRFEAVFQSNKIIGLGKFEYRQRNRTYYLRNLADPKSLDFQILTREFERQLEIERSKDIQEQSFSWFYDVKWQTNQKSFFQFNSIAQLLRVNTPSNRNDQDRDEVYYNGSLTYENQLFSQFKISFKSSGSFRHYVFIKPSQSIENFKDRVLRIDPSFEWHIGNLNWVGTHTIWVTYQVRDFAGEIDKNRSNRIFLADHKFNYPLTENSQIEFQWLYRENRLSRLDWNRFKESPIDTNIVNDFKMLFKKQNFSSESGGTLNWELGWRHFSQLRKSQSGFNQDGSGVRLIYLRNILWQTGPIGQFNWQTSKQFSCSLYLWFQLNRSYNRFISTSKEYVGPVSTAESLSVKENRNIPYFTIQFKYFP